MSTQIIAFNKYMNTKADPGSEIWIKFKIIEQLLRMKTGSRCNKGTMRE